MYVSTKHDGTVLHKAFSNMTAGWLYYMQTKKLCGYYASPVCAKTIPGVIWGVLTHFIGTVFKKTFTHCSQVC